MIDHFRDGKTWSVPYVTKAGVSRVRTVKIADCRKGYVNDNMFFPKKFNWKTTIRQRLDAGICELCGKQDNGLYEVHAVKSIKELGSAEWELVMKQKRRKTLVVCSECHDHIHK